MRILLLSDCYEPTVNGVVRSVSTLRRGLIARGHDVRVLAPGSGRSTTFDDGVYGLASVGVNALYPTARFGRPLDRDVQEHVLAWQPEIVHSHSEFVAFLWARRLVEHLGVPHVHTYHTVYEHYTHYFSPSRHLGRAVVARLTRRLLGRADLVIAPTAKVETLLSSYGLATPVSVIPTGIDLERFTCAPVSGPASAPVSDPSSGLISGSASGLISGSASGLVSGLVSGSASASVSGPASDPATLRDTDTASGSDLRRRLGLPDGVPVVVSVGRLAHEKNLTEAIELLARHTTRDWRFVVVGDGPQAGSLRQLTTRLGVSDRVLFTGAVDPARVADYYRLGDLFVSSSRSETQGLTYLEALASGLPVLCRADPVLDGVVTDGVNGYQYTRATDFDTRFTSMLDDQALRLRLSRGARMSALGHSDSRFAAAVLGAYALARGAARLHRTDVEVAA